MFCFADIFFPMRQNPLFCIKYSLSNVSTFALPPPRTLLQQQEVMLASKLHQEEEKEKGKRGGWGCWFGGRGGTPCCEGDARASQPEVEGTT